MDAACRVKSDRSYTVAAIDNLEEEFGLFLKLVARSRVAPTRHSDDLSLSRKRRPHGALQDFPGRSRQCIDPMKVIGAFKNQLRLDFIRPN